MKENDLTVNPMLSPSTDWEEEFEPGEQELFERFASEVIVDRQREVAQQRARPAMRGFHAKLHAGLMAEFQVLPDLPEHARVGIFSEPRVFPAVVRFSNGTPFRQADKRREPRGIGIKLVGVPGDKLLEGQEKAVTQDFLATSHSVTSTVRNMRQFMAFIDAERNHRSTLPFALARSVGVMEAGRILIAFVRTVIFSKVRSMATEHYASTAPVKFGPYAVKFTVRPVEETRRPVERPLTDDFLREELADRLREGDLLFDFVVQFYVNKKLTPIEDTSVEWKAEHAPFMTVAKLRIPKCDLTDPRTDAMSEAVNRLSFTPWHATEDHRPLGNVMRARKVAYLMSSDFRQHLPEPASLPL
ncbi:MAG TPA: catalase family protein [Pyrinomonadaceae bacterium]